MQGPGYFTHFAPGLRPRTVVRRRFVESIVIIFDYERDTAVSVRVCVCEVNKITSKLVYIS